MTEPIIAYRAWNVSPHDHHLISCAHNTTAWPRVSALKAGCLHSHADQIEGPWVKWWQAVLSFTVGIMALAIAIYELRRGEYGWAAFNVASGIFNLFYVARYFYERRPRRVDLRAPMFSCSCGIYCFKDEATLAASGYVTSAIIGRVAIWGKIIEHADGYRAEFAYPQVFYLRGDASDKLTRKIAALYGAECIPMPDAIRLHITSSPLTWAQYAPGSIVPMSQGVMFMGAGQAQSQHNAALQQMLGQMGMYGQAQGHQNGGNPWQL